jgi:hypothetical protein
MIIIVYCSLLLRTAHTYTHTKNMICIVVEHTVETVDGRGRGGLHHQQAYQLGSVIPLCFSDTITV